MSARCLTHQTGGHCRAGKRQREGPTERDRGMLGCVHSNVCLSTKAHACTCAHVLVTMRQVHTQTHMDLVKLCAHQACGHMLTYTALMHTHTRTQHSCTHIHVHTIMHTHSCTHTHAHTSTHVAVVMCYVYFPPLLSPSTLTIRRHWKVRWTSWLCQRASWRPDC